MSFSFHPEAATEFDAAVEWYEQRGPGLGLDFGSEVRLAILLAENMPLAWTRIKGNVRRVLVNRYPYGVLYAPEGEHLFIIAVMHLSRKPGYWAERINV